MPLRLTVSKLKIASKFGSISALNQIKMTYENIHDKWNNSPDDKSRFNGVIHGVKRLANDLDTISPDPLIKEAKKSLLNSESLAKTNKYSNAVDSLSFSIAKLRLAISKVAYGYDVSGEVGEVSQEGRSPNLWDRGNASGDFEHTPGNPANVVDAEAEEDFPEELKSRHERVEWPTRSR